MLNRLEEDNLFLDKIVFSDEVTFHLSGKVNRHNLIIWRSQNPHQVVEHVRDSPKVNVFCAVSRTQVYGPFFFAEATVTGHEYLDMLEHFLVPQLDVHSVIWQQDGAPQSQGCDAVPESNIPGKMDRSWWLHPLATQITRSDTHGLFILGIREI
jgi:hypothetical protein